jgi:hypothetical protein
MPQSKVVNLLYALPHTIQPRGLGPSTTIAVKLLEQPRKFDIANLISGTDTEKRLL